MMKSIKSLYLAALHELLCGKSHFYSTATGSVYAIFPQKSFLLLLYFYSLVPFLKKIHITVLLHSVSTRFESSPEKYCVNMCSRDGGVPPASRQNIMFSILLYYSQVKTNIIYVFYHMHLYPCSTPHL